MAQTLAERMEAALSWQDQDQPISNFHDDIRGWIEEVNQMSDGVANPDAIVRVVKTEEGWPDRPDVNYVEWVGPGPAPPADADNDTWVETGV